jgi:FkbM family methyltransferase
MRKLTTLYAVALSFLLFVIAVLYSYGKDDNSLKCSISALEINNEVQLLGNATSDLRSSDTSQLSPSFKRCMIDVGRHLPIKRGSGELVAHLYVAERFDLWNEGVRFQPLQNLPEAPLILDIGGNTVAGDSRKLLEMFPKAIIHIYEPIPPFVEELKKNWNDLKDRVEIHDVGLGNSNKTITIPKSALDGQGTFIGDSNKNEKNKRDVLDLKVVDAKSELMQYLNQNFANIDILHMNCEGCEWEALMRLAETDMLQKVRVLQVSFHNYGDAGIGALLPKYCLIREKLEITHEKVEAIPFGWERWVRKKI